MIQRPAENEFAPFYAGYVALVPEDGILAVLDDQLAIVQRLAARVPADRERFRYAPGKWSIREVIGHLIDSERVFGYRALCIARGDRTPLPGFDEQEYMAGARYDESDLASLAGEFAHLRAANASMLRRLDPAAWLCLGTANGTPISTRALAWIMAGHARHHLGTLRDRYGVEAGA